MSSGNSVLDNWEEIDEAGLSSQLEQIKQVMNPHTSNMLHDGPVMFMMQQNEDYGASYTQPQRPAVKILRRPTQQSDSKSLDAKPKQPIKTLQQREQEYAEARLRILGSAKNPEDEVVTLPKLVAKDSDECAVITDASESENASNMESSIMFGQSNNILNTNGQLKAFDNVLRLPRGPDGTKGFNIRR